MNSIDFAISLSLSLSLAPSFLHSHFIHTGAARYTVNEGVELNIQHDTLRRYITAPKMRLPDVPTGHGPVHNITPLYDSMDEDGIQAAHYDTPVVIVNPVCFQY